MEAAYINEMESIGYWLGSDDRKVVEVVAGRYIGASPAVPFVYRAFHGNGILQDDAGLYIMDLADKLPEAKLGQYAYIYGLVWGETERALDLNLRCLGPVRLYMNGRQIYRSNVIDEIKPDAEVRIGVEFAKGWNTLLVKVRKTAAGFGCLLGAEEAKVRILNVLAPFAERKGQAGWVYSQAVDQDRWPDDNYPDALGTEKSEEGIIWHPATAWSEHQRRSQLNCERLFGILPGKVAYAWSKLKVTPNGDSTTCVLQGDTAGPLKLWVNGSEAANVEAAGEFRCVLELPFTTTCGEYDVLVRSVCGSDSWGFHLAAEGDWISPHTVQGTREPWFYAGPFDVDTAVYTPEQMQSVRSLYRLSGSAADGSGMQQLTFWQLDAPELRIRPYYENALLSSKWTTSGVTNFARWDYPLGVTMYGLLQAGRLLERRSIIDYVLEHITLCTDMYEYSLWDRAAYGFPAVNQQLVMMKMLDNCGSFGSAMLEAYTESHDPRFLAVAEVIANFITKKLERKEDGAFYRVCEGEYSENTMWADDLYMSTPFLIRYYQITGKREYLDEAAKQFLLFKKYLFIPQLKLMSHVYDFKYDTPTFIPWGRGNGWCLFSLSEILAALPSEHPDRKGILEFFNDMCEGVAAQQSQSGLWHQVLNDPEAYLEASCTAMFTYAFARGVRHGWLNPSGSYYSKALKGWAGLTSHAIDRHGSVFGVCSGSRYAFTADYYKEDLRTVTNDNHGIGIMMLAGVEICKMKEMNSDI